MCAREPLGRPLRENRLPSFDGGAIAAVNLEPAERLGKKAPVRQRALGTRAGSDVPQAAL